MMVYRKIAWTIVVLASLAGLRPQPLLAQSHDVIIAVVVQPDTPVSNLSLAEVRKIFLGRQAVLDGKHSRGIAHPSSCGARAGCGPESHLPDV